MSRLSTAIQLSKDRLKKSPMVENFGQDHVRLIKDRYGYNPHGSPEERRQADEIDRFDDWCMNYTKH